MFKCVECGREYKIKPDYCDCGNDIFELIEEQIEQEQNLSEITPEYQTPFNSIEIESSDFDHSFNTNIQKNTIIEQQRTSEPFSVIIFMFCILLSVLTIFFLGNPKENIDTTKQPVAKTVQLTQDIPNVDTFWDNSTAEIKPDITENNGIKTNEIKVNIEENSKNINPDKKEKAQAISFSDKFEQWLNTPSKYPTTSQTTNTGTIKPQTNAAKTVVQTTKTATTNTQQAKQQIQNNNSQTDLISRIQKKYNNPTTTPATTQTKTTTTNTAKTNSTTPISNSNKKLKDPLANMEHLFDTKTNNTPSVTTGTTTVATQPKTTTTTTQTQQKTEGKSNTTTNIKSQAQINQELSTYKASLRNNIGRKINFTNVVGDGSCAITFTINSSGKLTNRNFSQKSTNITLNDAVYNAMLSTPSYNPPPEGYKNETLTFYVKIYNGNYEISLQ